MMMMIIIIIIIIIEFSDHFVCIINNTERVLASLNLTPPPSSS